MRCGTSPTTFNRGFALRDAVAVTVVLAVLSIIAVYYLGKPRRGHQAVAREEMQLRGLLEAMQTWAAGNHYPLPSEIDYHNDAVSDLGNAKNTTANILSLLIFHGLISPDMCISPAESNPRIVRAEDYQFANPKYAVHPNAALWDPAFTCDFSQATGVANNSYAHLLPAGGRKVFWSDTGSPDEPIIGNRGPLVASINRDTRSIPAIRWANAESYTFLIHGGPRTWEGYIAYNDGHVGFETSASPSSVRYKRFTTKDGVPDVLFYDEPDDADGMNAYLSIFTKAGDKPEDFKPIWD